jgi:glycosyltransferase involved in cell wall biosynthesis
MISVVIATRDRAKLLAATLEAVVAQDPPGQPFEVVVVDNASVDDTPGIVEALTRRSTVPVVYLTEMKSGKSHALNSAITRARGELLVFTDDDVIPSPGWLAAYARAFTETGADYAVGRILPLWEVPPPGWMSPAFYGALAVPDAGTKRLPLGKGLNEEIMPIGANMAVRRHVLDRVGGWNPNLGKLQGTLRTGEDHEFALKMLSAGFRGVYDPRACVQHRVPPDRLRLGYFRRWFYDNGIIVAGFEEEYPSTTRYLLNVPRHLWRQLAHDLLRTAWGILTWDSQRSAAGEMQLAWFAGYLRGRWSRRPAVRGVQATAAPRGLDPSEPAGSRPFPRQRGVAKKRGLARRSLDSLKRSLARS